MEIETLKILKKPKKKVIKQVKAGDIIEVDEIQETISYNKAKKLRPKIQRSEKQKLNDERLRNMQKERFKKPEPITDQVDENKVTEKKKKLLKVLPKRINKKKIKILETVDETNDDESSDDEEIKILKKRVKKISLKKELYDHIENIKVDVGNNQYNNMMNRVFRR